MRLALDCRRASFHFYHVLVLKRNYFRIVRYRQQVSRGRVAHLIFLDAIKTVPFFTIFGQNLAKVQSCPAKVDRIASLSSTHPHEVQHKNMTGDKPCHPPAGVTAAPKTWASCRPSSGPQARRAMRWRSAWPIPRARPTPWWRR